MASKRSCFNPTLLRKNLLRFWPCWTGTLLLAVLILPVGMARGLSRTIDHGFPVSSGYASEFTLGMLSIVLAAAIGLGILIPALLNRYLYTARSANFFHSLPIRREGLLLTNAVSGLVMIWGPMILTAVITIFVELSFGVVDLLSVAQLLLFGLCVSLFFFSLGMLCMHLTGMLIAGLGLYAVLNGLAITIYFILSSLVELFVVGFSTSDGTLPILRYLTPIWSLSRACEIYYYDSFDVAQTFGGQMAMMPWSNVGVAGAYALGGVCLLALTLLLCRARKTERAGDLIAFGWLRPVFKVSVSLIGGGAMCLLTVALYDLIPSFWKVLTLTVAWSLVAWLVAEMMVQKSVKVFHKPVFAHWSVVAICVALLFTGMRMDLFGIERRVPAPKEVVSVVVSTAGRTAPGVDVEKVVALHQTIVDHRKTLQEQDTSYTASITFEYTLTGDRSLRRTYHIPREDNTAALTRALYDFVADPEVAMAMAFDGLLEQSELTDLSVEYEIDSVGYTLDLNNAQKWRIYQAIEADIREGRFNFCSNIFYSSELEQVNVQITIHYLHKEERKPGSSLSGAIERSHWTGFWLTTKMTHTIACLQELGLPTEALLTR